MNRDTARSSVSAEGWMAECPAAGTGKPLCTEKEAQRKLKETRLQGLGEVEQEGR